MRRRQALAAAGAAAAVCGPPRPAPAQQASRRNDLEPMALPVKQDDTVARGYRRDLLLRWGDRVAYDAPRWEPNVPRPDAAAGQFGWDARVAAVAVPQRQAADGVPRAVLAVLHPTVDPLMAWPGGVDRPVVAAAMQGVSLLNLEKLGSGWVVVDGGYQTRRLHGGTLCRVSGPHGGAGGGSVQGLLGPRGGCTTPWGTLLLAEGDPAPWIARLGAAPDARFRDAGGFGWVAELDPFDPGAVPVKRTALGRDAHGDVAAALARDGRAVVYTTDGRPGGFLRRFVSAGLATAAGALDSGTLSVARLAEGRLDWVPLPPGADAAAAGGSPLDTPAGLGLDPAAPRLVLCCHGSPARPRGYVLEVSAAEGDDAAPGASVRTLFVAGAPGEGGQYGRGGLPPGSAWPENPAVVAVDGRGRAWIGTDRAGLVGAQADGLFACDLDGPARGVPLPVYGAPRAGAIGGAALTPDGEVLFAAVRHPGAEPGARFERPGTRWPEFAPGVPPRSALLGFQREAGGPVGG